MIYKNRPVGEDATETSLHFYALNTVPVTGNSTIIQTLTSYDVIIDAASIFI